MCWGGIILMISCKIKEVINKHLKSMGIKLAMCIILYSMIIVCNLVNRQDGMWNGPYYPAGNWELSIGRWAIRYLDCFQFGIHVNPITTIVTLLLFVLGTEIMIGILGVAVGSWKDYLISMLFLGNMVICISLSYLYTSAIYGLAFLIGMLCVKCIIDSEKKKYLLFVGAVCLALVMGLYQSYLGCIVLTVVTYLIVMSKGDYELREIGRFVLRGLGIGVMGLCLYEVILYLNLYFFKVSISSYNGGDQISLSVIVSHLLPSMKRAYVGFFKYLTGKSYSWNVYSDKVQEIIFVIILIYYIVFGGTTLFKSIIHRSLWMLFVLLLPLAANITFILAPQSAFLEQQTAPMALMVSMAVVLLLKISRKKAQFLQDMAIAALSVFLLFGTAYQTLIDQEAMREGTISSETMAQNIFQSLVERGCYSPDKRYAIIGTPGNNPMFFVTPIYNKANWYARIGGPWWESALDSRSWGGIYHYRLGINILTCYADEYEELLKSDEVKNMPIYPSEGFIQEINGIIVIRVS